ALFAAGDSKSRWLAISLQGDDAARVLDRIEIPADMHKEIAEKLTPGSSLIVADKSINSAILPEGADFLVSANDTQVVAEKSESKPKPAQVAQARTKRSDTPARRNTFARRDILARSNSTTRTATQYICSHQPLGPADLRLQQ